MNIEDLTIGQAREIAKLFQPVPDQHPFVGKYVLCRCYSAGVHTGELVSAAGDAVVLRNSRRLWSWKTNVGIALSGVAQHGLAGGCKVDTLNPEIALTGVIEIIPCSERAKEIIDGYAGR